MSIDTPPRWRKRTARFVEIAERAGVSTATVDRVLNERGSVSAKTRERVVAAARELALPRLLPETQHGLIHIDVLLPDSDAPFFCRLRDAVQRAMQMLDKRVVVHRALMSTADEARLPQTLAQSGYRRAALIVTTHDTPQVREALAAAIARGEPVVTMVTDVGGIERLHYAGIDNLRAGRTAGYFIGRLAREPGRVLLLPARMDYRAHVERIEGCRVQLAERFAHLACEIADEPTLDQDDRSFRSVSAALKRGGLVGIYNSGYGSAGIDAALRKFGAAGSVVWVGHEMLDQHRALIDAGVMDIVIDQDPDGQVISALQHVLHACGVVDEMPHGEPVEFRVFCSANVRDTGYLGG
ncbi:LacI family DNA-binding transcriptional regulator [Paraburkholderia edwinii]|uniref:LacI family DNA-binding transcriptional regulator n=1 Tax=Paraburkholderia edwinii TaxID=2861782 RepID=A0ABX8UX51_9BURK|nr:LacI family DNA-binding transcriptional regulator [Paraburkholderia edwinii]QYD73588.1 LacI family DNA-binding transcriptional regulator [Paraburkholderia edwinii]